MNERGLKLTELSYQLIAKAEQTVKVAQAHRDTLVAATLAAAGVPVAEVLRIDGSENGEKVLYYRVPDDPSKET